MSYAGSSSASDVKAESQAKVETASNAAASDDLMKKTIQIDTKETDKNGKDGNRGRQSGTADDLREFPDQESS